MQGSGKTACTRNEENRANGEDNAHNLVRQGEVSKKQREKESGVREKIQATEAEI